MPLSTLTCAKCLDGKRLELLLVGYFEKSKLLLAAKVQQGLNPFNCRALLQILRPLATAKCPFANLPTVAGRQAWGEGVTADEMAAYTWLRRTLRRLDHQRRPPPRRIHILSLTSPQKPTPIISCGFMWPRTRDEMKRL